MHAKSSPPPANLIVALLAMCLLTFASTDARAGTCLDGTDELACDTDATTGSTGSDICQLASGVLTCDLARIADTSAATVNAIEAGGNFEVFGTDGSGGSFCCIRAASGVTDVKVLGTSQGDTIDLEYVSGAGTNRLQPNGANLSCEVQGKLGNDTISGSGYAPGTYTYTEILKGDDGDDTIRGRGGDEEVHGGAGIDHLYGDAGTDTIYGGDGDDLLYGGTQADTIYGGLGGDYIEGESGTDTLYGDAGNDEIYGKDDADTIYGGDGADAIYGNAGNDYIECGEHGDWAEGGAGDDTIYGDGEDDVLIGDDDDDTLYGGDGNDTLCGGADNGTSTIVGDTLNGGIGDDIMWGLQGYTVGIYNDGDPGLGWDECDNLSTPS